MANYIKQYTPVNNLVKGPIDQATQLAVGSSLERGGDPIIGQIRYNTDTSLLEVYDGTAWAFMKGQGSAAITKTTVVTGNGIDTTFAGFFTTAPNSVESVIVVVGNVIQEPTTGYTISGTDITFTSPPPNTHRIYAFVGFDSLTHI